MSKFRIMLLSLLAITMFLVTLTGQPKSVEAQSCPSIGCGNWQYYGCCASNTRVYQRRTCCNGPTCCTQFMCTTLRCFF
jgi:hypothetical protein